MSAFSSAVHSRPSTSPQLRRNHLSTLAWSVKRRGLKAGASGAIVLPVVACLPSAVGRSPWQLAHDHSRPWVALKNCAPRAGSGAAWLAAARPASASAAGHRFDRRDMKAPFFGAPMLDAWG